MEFAKELEELGFEIIATSGTAKLLKKRKIKVTSVEKFAGIKEIFGGKLKTLSFKILGGILLDRKNKREMREGREQGILPIDMVVCNFYPPSKIDIGGPCMVRAGAKNYKFVIVLTDPKDYSLVGKLLKEKGEIPLSLRLKLAKKAFSLTAKYDREISRLFK